MSRIINNLRVSPSPHVHSSNTTPKIMRDVIIALLPAAIGAIYFFGVNSFLIMSAAIASAIISEYVWQKATKQRVTINDLSAVVTGLLVAFNMPPTVPLWIPIIGSAFAIIIVKQLYGGLGHNFMNPALAARVVLLLSFAVRMAAFSAPGTATIEMLAGKADVITSATPLAMLKVGTSANALPLMKMFIGNTGGCIGETSALLILIGGIYLIIRRVINARIPIAMLCTMAIMALVFGGKDASLHFVAAHIMGGGAMLGAMFMVTDYASTPVSTNGQVIFGVGVGLITMVIRLWGATPEGVSYGVLLMNICAPFIDKFTLNKPFGQEKKNKVGVPNFG